MSKEETIHAILADGHNAGKTHQMLLIVLSVLRNKDNTQNVIMFGYTTEIAIMLIDRLQRLALEHKIEVVRTSKTELKFGDHKAEAFRYPKEAEVGKYTTRPWDYLYKKYNTTPEETFLQFDNSVWELRYVKAGEEVRDRMPNTLKLMDKIKTGFRLGLSGSIVGDKDKVPYAGTPFEQDFSNPEGMAPIILGMCEGVSRKFVRYGDGTTMGKRCTLKTCKVCHEWSD